MFDFYPSQFSYIFGPVDLPGGSASQPEYGERSPNTTRLQTAASNLSLT
jgi:hypothetical protein